MPGYTVRTPYRVDEPKLGFEERELPGIDWVRTDKSGALECGRHPEVDEDPADGVVIRFAPSAWTSCRYGPFKDEA